MNLSHQRRETCDIGAESFLEQGFAFRPAGSPPHIDPEAAELILDRIKGQKITRDPRASCHDAAIEQASNESKRWQRGNVRPVTCFRHDGPYGLDRMSFLILSRSRYAHSAPICAERL